LFSIFQCEGTKRAPTPVNKRNVARAALEKAMSEQSQPSTPKDIGLKQVGAMTHALEISELTRNAEAVRGLDRVYSETGGSLAATSQKTGKDPLSAARSLVEIGRMDKADPRFKAALHMRLEQRNPQDFINTMSSSEAMHNNAELLSKRLLETGDQDGKVRMKALARVVHDGSMTPGGMAIALERVAMQKSESRSASPLPDELRDDFLMMSVRYGDAQHILDSRVAEKTTERRDDAR